MPLRTLNTLKKVVLFTQKTFPDHQHNISYSSAQITLKTPLKFIIVGATIDIFLRAPPPEQSQQPLPTESNDILACKEYCGMSGISIMLKIGAKSIHSDVHINQISNFVCQKPLPDRNEATHKISSNWSMLQKYKHTYIVLL